MTSERYTEVRYRYADDLTAYRQYVSKTGFYNLGVDRTRPSPYHRQQGNAIRWQKWKNGGATNYYPQNPTARSLHPTECMPFGAGGQSARNKAYEKFREEINGDTSAIGTALAEYKESLGMIQTRATGLYRAYRDLRKGDFRGCLRQLSVQPKRKHRNVIRTTGQEASGLWLEYWFGWSPTLSDIHNAANQLSEPTKLDGTSHKGQSSNRGYKADQYQSVSWRRRIRTGGKARMINPNLYLASQCGIVNPASVAWEIIPFSFLADWVFDVSSFLGSYTDFHGVELSDVYTSETSKITWTLKEWGPFSGTYISNQVFMERRLYLVRPLPNTDALRNLGSSLTRAASAVSLLTQILAE